MIEVTPTIVAEIREAPSVIITPLFVERADSRPIWCDTCRGVTMQKLTRTAEGREYRCECGGKTIYLIVRPVEWTK